MKSILTIAIIILNFFNISYGADLLNSHIKKEILTTHNYYRVLHHAPKLAWDESLARYATNYASHCRFQHSHGPYGENLAGDYPSVALAIKNWYAEKRHYSYFFPRFSMKTGHFTQVVWKSSKKIGCGYVTCNNNHLRPWKFLVCEYSPAGNVVNSGYFRANVLPV